MNACSKSARSLSARSLSARSLSARSLSARSLSAGARTIATLFGMASGQSGQFRRTVTPPGRGSAQAVKKRAA